MIGRVVTLVRTLPYLLALFPAALVAMLIPFALMLAGMSMALFGLGLVLIPVALFGVRLWTDLHRRWAGTIIGEPIPSRLRGFTGGPLTWLRQFIGDPTTYRDLLWVVLQVALGLPLGLAVLVLAAMPVVAVYVMAFWWIPADGDSMLIPDVRIDSLASAIGSGIPVLVLSVPALVYAVPPIARGWAQLTRFVLDSSGTEQLTERVEVLTETRAGAVDAHGAELRRIERDLHDGTQAKLVSIALRLGIAEQAMKDEPETAATLLQEARTGTEAAMGELRTIVRTMYPPILTDRGLVGALRSLVADSTVPAQADLEDPGPLHAAIEAAAYFVVSEALTNIAKHSGATFAVVDVRRVGDRLRVEVSDNGNGGVDEGKGTGISGMRRRIAALDGSVSVQSREGGPTVVIVELPCAP
ncbi:sensor histidine kinase [Amycolatopsis minnesotensis]|uniref:histidine kinase n=1 Tax=Amycolatopsis minnesotensis TaxID=337894 RepID=A0ABN2Q169_9PSEU